MEAVPVSVLEMPREPVYYHIDVNSAFLSWEAAYRLHLKGEEQDLREIPSVVGGSQKERHGIVLAKSIPARDYGIHTGEPLASARGKCPGLVVIPPDYELYVNCSRALIELLKNYSPDIHQYSIDEAFCDMTGMAGLFGSPVIFAGQLKEEIKETLGFTVNIGISSNKLLAKIASDFKKPHYVHTLFPCEIPAKLWSRPVGELFYVGRATAGKLRTLGIQTIGELANTDPELLKTHLKKPGEVLWHYANGRDFSPFLKMQEENKGYGNSITVPYDITGAMAAKQVLLSLTETVCARLRADGQKASCIGVSLLDCDFCWESRQITLTAPTNTTWEVYGAVCRVLQMVWQQRPIRRFGVHMGKLTKDAMYQYRLFDENRAEKYRRLDQAVDAIRKRYGEDAIMRASFLNSRISHMSGGIDKAKRTGVTKGLGRI